jgi:hypothetical protein
MTFCAEAFVAEGKSVPMRDLKRPESDLVRSHSLRLLPSALTPNLGGNSSELLRHCRSETCQSFPCSISAAALRRSNVSVGQGRIRRRFSGASVDSAGGLRRLTGREFVQGAVAAASPSCGRTGRSGICQVKHRAGSKIREHKVSPGTRAAELDW